MELKQESEWSDLKDDRVNPRKLFINFIPDHIHERSLEKFLSQFGSIREVSIWRDRETKRSLGKASVEFAQENEASKCVEAATGEQQLILDDYRLYVDYLKPGRSRAKQAFSPRNTSQESSAQIDQENTTPHSGAHINDLPYQLLIMIFSNLCIRDLCTVEKVCRKWYQFGRMTWSCKKRLKFDDQSVYENYTKRDNPYGFDCRPVFNFKAFQQIMKKNLGPSLRHLDVSGLSDKLTQHSNDCIEIIGYECPNLVTLNLSHMSFSNKPFGKTMKYLKKIQEVDISNCYRISDIGLTRVFQKCPELRSINISFCLSINGSCFEATNGQLESITLDGCSIDNQFYPVLVKKNQRLKYMSARNAKLRDQSAVLELIHNVPALKTLKLSDSGFDCLIGNSEIDFSPLKNLQCLEIDGSKCDNKIVSAILKHCTSLKTLNIGNCMGLNDEMLATAEINASLESLDLAFLKQITDLSLEKIWKDLKTIKRLTLKGCFKLTNEGLQRLIWNAPNLCYLDVRFIEKVDNSILEAALGLEPWNKILIKCSDTSVDPTKFVYNHTTTSKTNIDRDLYSYSLDNLTFETFITKRIINQARDDVWDEDNGFFYMGSEFEDSDMEAYFPNEKPISRPPDNFEDAESDRDDFDDFINNEETEMYNELDEY